MADFQIKEPKEFSESIRKLEVTDKGHADVFNAVLGQLVNNDAYLHELIKNKVLLGPENTELEPGSILFVTEETNNMAVFSNMSFSSEEPSTGQNWGRLEGKLTVADTSESDTVFFAQIN